MGSFNVACSVSNLSLGCGDPIAFIPLVPAKYTHGSLNENPHQIIRSHMLTYSNCYFDPLCLPIFGIYNDYGSLEDIQEDTNTRCLEKFFNLPTQEIINCLTSNSATEIYGHINMPEDQTPALWEWGRELDEEWFKQVGFTKHQTANRISFRWQDFPYYVEIVTITDEFTPVNGENAGVKQTRKEPGWIIRDETGKEIKKSEHSYRLVEELVVALQDLTGFNIRIRPEDQERAKILDQLSGMFVHKDIYYALVNSPAYRFGKDKTVAENRVTEKQLAEFGFEPVPEEEQISIDPHHKHLYRKKGFPFDIKWGPYGMAIVHQKYKEYYVFGDVKNFSVDAVWRNWEKMTGTSPSATFPCPKNPKSPTMLERSEIVKTFGELTGGATLSWAPQKEDTNHHIFSLVQFVRAWETMTGELLDISHHRKKTKHELLFEELQEKILEYRNTVPEVYTLAYGSVEEQRQCHEQEQTFAKSLAILDNKEFIPAPFEPKPEGKQYQKTQNISLLDPFKHFGRFGSSDGFLEHYKDWKYFQELYEDAIADGHSDLKQAFCDEILFRWEMYSCNRFYFPAMNGEQCGNDAASRNLLLASLRIVDQRLADRQEDTLETIAWDSNYYGEENAK